MAEKTPADADDASFTVLSMSQVLTGFLLWGSVAFISACLFIYLGFKLLMGGIGEIGPFIVVPFIPIALATSCSVICYKLVSRRRDWLALLALLCPLLALWLVVYSIFKYLLNIC